MLHPPRTTATPRPPRALTGGALAVVLALALAFGGVLASCSLLLDADAAQCRSDGECARFGQAMCDNARRICVARPDSIADSGTGTDGDGADSARPPTDGVDGGADAGVDVALCRGGDGCLPCAPGTAAGLLNACSDSECVAFDNHTRLHNLTPDGAVKPLP